MSKAGLLDGSTCLATCIVFRELAEKLSRIANGRDCSPMWPDRHIGGGEYEEILNRCAQRELLLKSVAPFSIGREEKPYTEYVRRLVIAALGHMIAVSVPRCTVTAWIDELLEVRARQTRTDRGASGLRERNQLAQEQFQAFCRKWANTYGIACVKNRIDTFPPNCPQANLKRRQIAVDIR